MSQGFKEEFDDEEVITVGVDLKGIISPMKLSLESLSGMTLAIDAYNALYQFLAIIRGEAGEHLYDRSGRVTSHLSGLFYRNVNLLAMGIKPVYILDGRPPELKTVEISRRKEAKEVARERYAEAVMRGDYKSAKKHAQATSVLKDYMVEDTKRVLDLLGISWILAPSEGEATAAHLAKVSLADASVSQDYDSLLFGATKLIRNVTISGRRKLPNKPVYVEIEPEVIELKKVLSELQITKEQLVDLGILVGTDFNPDGFKGIGPTKALNYIKKYGRLEDISEIREELEGVDFRAIRKIFLSPEVTAPSAIRHGEPDYDGLVTFLCGERSFSQERVGKALSKLKEAGKKRKIETLDRFF